MASRNRATASPQDLIDALKQRVRTDSPPHSTNSYEELRHCVDQNNSMRSASQPHMSRPMPPQRKGVLKCDEGNVCVLFDTSVCRL